MFASTQDPEFVQGQSRDVPNRELGPNRDTPPCSKVVVNELCVNIYNSTYSTFSESQAFQ